MQILIELKKNFSHVTYDIVEPDQSIFKENSNLITNFYLNINEIVNEKYDLIILNCCRASIQLHILNKRIIK